MIGDVPARRPRPASLPAAFDLPAFLKAAGVRAQTPKFPAGGLIFRQGMPAAHVGYLLKGGVKLSVVSSGGKEAIIAVCRAGDFVGEGCLAGQPSRMATATAIEPTTMLRIRKADMVRLLQEHPEFSNQFIAHMLARNIRVEESLVDQLFNSSEKRLARTLLLLARYGDETLTQRTLPKLSQETLAEMVGTTRSRVNVFMNKFRKLGFIKYNGGIKVNGALLSLVLHD
jgi:CRP-like cAMP-binding protein